MAKQQQVENENGHDEDVMSYEQELSELLQARIKPGLNGGSIPMLARSIAKEIARRDPPEAESEDEEMEDEPVEDEAGDEPRDEADDEEMEDEPVEDEGGDEELTDEADEEYAEEVQQPDYAEMQDVQADLGEEWILRFSVQGDEAWLTAETDDGRQRLEAPNLAVLVDAVELLNGGGAG